MNTNQELSESAVREGLSRVLDPEYGVPITDLGLVLHVDIKGTYVEVALVLTTPSCPAGGVIVEGVRNAVLAVPGVESAEAYVSWEVEWTPGRMSDSARRILGWGGE